MGQRPPARPPPLEKEPCTVLPPYFNHVTSHPSLHSCIFCIAGTAMFGEHGWWSLTAMVPPNLRLAMGGSVLGKRAAMAGSPGPLNSQDLAPPSKKPRPSGEHVKPRKVHRTVSPSPPLMSSDIVSPQSVNLPLGVEDAESDSYSMVALTEQQEKVLEKYLHQNLLAVGRHPKASRLLRKLKVRSKQRLYNQSVFDLDSTICNVLSSTVKYVVDKNAPYSEQVFPVLRPSADTACLRGNAQTVVVSRLETPTTPQVEVLDQLSLIPVLSRALAPEVKTFRQMLCGAGDTYSFITSPYTNRKLAPFIFRTPELLPLKVKVNRELAERFETHSASPQTIDFCYLQEHHLPAVNNFVSHFFWAVDLSECLQYPDFTCVVLHGKLVVGCGFMTPDVKVNEAYISFLLVHPDFQNSCIGKIILYHLIQSCMGKDVTLHVSVDNPAMMLYQTMGFKAERYCMDFYRYYYPEGHHLSKNAYFMRLRK